MKTKLLISILFALGNLFAVGQSVPNTTTFTLQTVSDVVNPTTDDLVDCLSDAISGYFNPAYSGSKNSLLNFQDYGPHNDSPPLITTSIGASVTPDCIGWVYPKLISGFGASYLNIQLFNPDLTISNILITAVSLPAGMSFKYAGSNIAANDVITFAAGYLYVYRDSYGTNNLTGSITFKVKTSEYGSYSNQITYTYTIYGCP